MVPKSGHLMVPALQLTGDGLSSDPVNNTIHNGQVPLACNSQNS